MNYTFVEMEVLQFDKKNYVTIVKRIPKEEINYDENGFIDYQSIRNYFSGYFKDIQNMRIL
jgi:hypothetical protein